MMVTSLSMAQNVVAKNATIEFNVEQLALRSGCLHPRVARRIIRRAACMAGMNFRRCWVRYVQGINTIQPITDGFRVALARRGGGFVIIDVLEDL